MFRLAFCAFLAAFLASAEPACAQDRPQQEWGAAQPLDRLLPQIRERHPGTFYDAEGPFSDENGGLHYRLKWMTPDGRVIWLDTDARTGRVLGVQHNGFRGQSIDAPPRDAFPPPDRARNFDMPTDRGNPHQFENRWPSRGGGWNGHGNHDNHHGGY